MALSEFNGTRPGALTELGALEGDYNPTLPAPGGEDRATPGITAVGDDSGSSGGSSDGSTSGSDVSTTQTSGGASTALRDPDNTDSGSDVTPTGTATGSVSLTFAETALIVAAVAAFFFLN